MSKDIYTNILHLSDLHFGSGKNKITQSIYDGFIEKLESFLANNETWKPSIVIVTGDIAFKGSEQNYEEAAIFFEKLKTKLGTNNIIFTPGNHDKTMPKAHLDIVKKWKNINNNSKKANGTLNKIYNTIDEWKKPKKSSKKIKEILDKLYQDDKDKLKSDKLYLFSDYFKNYIAFCENLEIIKPTYGDYLQGIYEVDGSDVVVISYNSSWLCFGGNIDYGKLHFDDNHKWLCGDYIKKNKDLKNKTLITIFHHRNEWFDHSERFETLNSNKTLQHIIKHSDMILCGHDHTIRSKPDLLNNKTQLITGGALLGTPEKGKFSYWNNFSILHINNIYQSFERQSFLYLNIPGDEDDEIWKELKKELYYLHKSKWFTPSEIESLLLENKILKNVAFSRM